MLGRLALLLGLLAVPVALLWIGVRVRYAQPRVRGLFWGMLTGHLLALTVGLWAALTPAMMWGSANVVRGFFGLWSYLVLPVVGGVIGALLRGRSATAG